VHSVTNRCDGHPGWSGVAGRSATRQLQEVTQPVERVPTTTPRPLAASVNPPIQVATAAWSRADQLDGWMKERQEWWAGHVVQTAVNGGLMIILLWPGNHWCPASGRRPPPKISNSRCQFEAHLALAHAANLWERPIGNQTSVCAAASHHPSAEVRQRSIPLERAQFRKRTL
jgi:hypothetical protein